jgi:hypothetical protein
MSSLLGKNRRGFHLLRLDNPFKDFLVTAMIARLANEGLVHVIDCAGNFRGEELIHFLKLITEDQVLALQQLKISHARTSRELASILSATHTVPTPVVILDMAAPFLLESEPLNLQKRLLDICLVRIYQIRKIAFVLATCNREENVFTSRLIEKAGRIWDFDLSGEEFENNKHHRGHKIKDKLPNQDRQNLLIQEWKKRGITEDQYDELMNIIHYGVFGTEQLQYHISNENIGAQLTGIESAFLNIAEQAVLEDMMDNDNLSFDQIRSIAE